MTRNLNNYRGAILAAGILTIILVASARGYLTFLNGAIYDWISAVPLHQERAQTSPVLLFDMDGLAYHSADADWSALLSRLENAQPKQVLLLEAPRHLQDATYAALTEQVHLVGTTPDLVEGGFRMDANFRRLAPVLVPSPLPHSDHGVFRRLPLVGSETDRVPNSLIALASQRHTALPVKLQEVYPNFVAGGLTPPRISMQRLLTDDLPAGLLSDKTILIAPAPESAHPPLYTPGGSAGARDLAGFYARALHSLITDRYILQFPTGALLASLLLLALGCLVFYQRAGLTLAIYFTGGMVFISVVLSVVLLHYLYIWFPLAETLTTLFGIWIAVLNRKYVAEQDAMLLELNNISRLMQKRLVPEDVLRSGAYWEQIARMVQRLLALNRSIFLETQRGERRVREIQALNCELSDIDERRRDYERSPYTLALRARGPFRVQGYLKQGAASEQQYLVPLQAGGEVLGFWAFGIESNLLAERDDLLALIFRLAEDIAELLAQRQQLQRGEQREQRRWLDYLTLQGGRSLAADLKAALNITTKRLRLVEELFNRSDTAFLLYDTFGQLLLDNDAARRLCRRLNIEAFDLSYTDTLAQLTGLDAEAAKDQLQSVVLNQASIALPLATEDSRGVLTLHPLGRAYGSDTDTDHADSGFTHSGIVMEISQGQPGGLPSKPSRWLLNLLAQQADVLQAEAHSSSRPVAACESSEFSRLTALIDNAREFLRSERLEDIQVDGFPTVARAFQEAFAASGAEARKKRVTIHCDEACDRTQLMLPPERLQTICQVLVEFALRDAKRGTSVTVSLTEGWPAACVRVQTDGIGLPARALTALLEPCADSTDNRRFSLADAARIAERYRGSLQVDSEVGVGTRIDLRLPALAAAREL